METVKRIKEFITKYKKPIVLSVCGIIILLFLFYLSGILGQAESINELYKMQGGFGKAERKALDFGLWTCLGFAFSPYGLKAFIIILLVLCGFTGVFFFGRFFTSKKRDSRGVVESKTGEYGTATWMTDEEKKEKLEIATPENAMGTILGEDAGKLLSIPVNTRLNKNMIVMGGPGTMKSRAIIRNLIFQSIKRNESIIVTDPKGEMYTDTAEICRQNGYDVKVFNLVDPTHSDSWNCLSELDGRSLMVQVLTNVIIANTNSGKTDIFWDNGELNLLKSLVLLVFFNKDESLEKSLPIVYELLTKASINRLVNVFDQLGFDSPAKSAFNSFLESSPTVKEGIYSGLTTRLQLLSDPQVQNILRSSDINLSAPAQKKCAYYVIISDQDSTMTFISSLFFSFLFLKLIRYADSRPNKKCDVPVNLILDEFNNIGKIGGKEDGSDFTKTLSVCRSRDIRVTLAIQSLGQLKNRYKDELWSEIIGNCDTQLMLGCIDDDTAEYFSNQSGEMTIEINSNMQTRRTFSLAQVIPEYRHTESKTSRKILLPDEVKRLPDTELLCKIKGCNILKLKKWDYTGHPLAKEIVPVDLNDYYPKTVLSPINVVVDYNIEGQSKTVKRNKDKKTSAGEQLEMPTMYLETDKHNL